MADPFGRNANKVTIKGGKASRSQREILARALRYADKVGAPYKAKQALIAALIVESEAKNLSTPSADGYGSYGVLQGLERYHSRKNLMNPEYQFGVFLGQNKKYPKGFTGKGNAIQLAKTRMSPGDIAQAVEGSAYPDRYGQVMNEANKIIRLYRGGGSLPGAPKSDKETGGVKAPAASNGAEVATTLLNYAKMKRQGRASVSDLASALVSSENAVDTTPSADAPKQPKQEVKTGVGSGGGKGSGIKELFYDPQGAWKGTTRIPKIGGHTDHVHVAAGEKTVVRLGRVAQKMGLRVGENPAFDKVDPVHTPTSWHYKNRAIDVSGSPQKMAAFTRYVRRKYGLK